MASWDTPGVPSPTAKDYAGALVNFDAIANLQKKYYEGADQQRNEDKQNLFRNGIPRVGGGDTGPYDLDKIASDTAKVGGPDYAKPFMDMQINSQIAQDAANKVKNPSGVPDQGPPIGQPTPYGAPKPPPRFVTPVPGSSPAQPPAAPAAVAANDAQDTIRSLATEWSGGNDAMPAIGSAARTLRIHPDAPLTPEQTAKVKSFLSNAARGPAAGSAATQPQSQPQPQPQLAAQPVAAPVAPQQPPVAPNARVAQGFDDIPEYAKKDMNDATSLRADAARYAAMGQKGAAETLNKEADAREARATQAITAAQAAPAIKEWRQSGSKLPYDEWVAQAEGSKESAKEDAKAYSTKYATLVENGTKAQQEIPQLELLQEQMNNDPNFFTGAGEKYNLLYKRLKSAVGMDPDAAVPQELLRKVTASNVLSSLGALKGMGPIRVAEMNMAREAAASPENSVPANKMLVEISKRTHQRNAEIADMAQTYKDQNGTLDPGFDKKVSAYYNTHPMFTDAEIKDWHRIIGEQPKSVQKPGSGQGSQMPTFATPSAVHAANLPSGTKFLDANGVVRKVP